MFELIGQNHAALSEYFTYQVIEDVVLNGGAVALDSQRREPLETARIGSSYRSTFMLRLDPKWFAPFWRGSMA